MASFCAALPGQARNSLSPPRPDFWGAARSQLPAVSDLRLAPTRCRSRELCGFPTCSLRDADPIWTFYSWRCPFLVSAEPCSRPAFRCILCRNFTCERRGAAVGGGSPEHQASPRRCPGVWAAAGARSGASGSVQGPNLYIVIGPRHDPSPSVRWSKHLQRIGYGQPPCWVLHEKRSWWWWWATVI